MKYLVLIILLTNICFISNAQQFAIINDKDGFVNVRKDKSANSPIVGKILNHSIFDAGYPSQNQSNWVRIYKQYNEDVNAGFVGYIYHDKILPLSNFKFISVVKIFKDSCFAINDSLKIVVKSLPFDSKVHKLSYDSGLLDKIDGKMFWAPSRLPKRGIELRVFKSGQLIAIPKDAYNNAYDPQFKSLKVYLGNDNTIYIQMYNGETDNPYCIIWTIRNGKYLSKYQESLI